MLGSATADLCEVEPILDTPRKDPAPSGAVQDLTVPSVTLVGSATPGKRVRQVLSDYMQLTNGKQCTQIHHLLYLPSDWQPSEKKYPIIVEYAGNKWRTSQGTVEGSSLAYGMTAGVGSIIISMPFVDTASGRNQVTWWGNVDATLDYCQQVVAAVCDKYGGDCDNVFLAGFSRGSIGCNYIGLHNDEIAKLWKGFICHSHYDGVASFKSSGYQDRLARLKGRPQWISNEGSTDKQETYLKTAAPDGDFTFQALQAGFGHTDQWTLYNVAERDALRRWYQRVISKRTTADDWCQEMSDKFGINYNVGWGNTPKGPIRQEWWNTRQCRTCQSSSYDWKDGKCVPNWCQEMSDRYGINYYVSWGTAPDQGPIRQEWWYERKCKTCQSGYYIMEGNIKCQPGWCQEMSNKFGISSGSGWGTAPEAVQKDWVLRKCRTCKPGDERFEGKCRAKQRRRLHDTSASMPEMV